ncbi:MAG: hypothetical protein E6G57_09245 [Actinobacteria bacterium]|nr:MAG: hypothetical protein E6G57_09245 [Actinomycetota bacterium]
MGRHSPSVRVVLGVELGGRLHLGPHHLGGREPDVDGRRAPELETIGQGPARAVSLDHELHGAAVGGVQRARVALRQPP